MEQKQNRCLIDWFRCSIPNTNLRIVANDILGIDFSNFVGGTVKGSPYPSYNTMVSFANINLHSSENHKNVLIDLSGQGCRQYEEYMDRVEGWHWYRLISYILEIEGKISRIDLALDVFDNSSPSVRTLQDYIKRAQLSTKSHKFVEINSGRILDGKLTGFTLYIGAPPQILRIYDKKQERRDNVGEIVNVEQWVRWELELTGKKAMLVAFKISNGKPLNLIIKGILSAHYCFKTKPKNTSDLHNKNRLSNMRWWDKFVGGIEAIPLKVQREKMTLQKKKRWVEENTAKSISMIYEVFESVYGSEFAGIYLKELIENGKQKINVADRTLIDQRILELINEEEY
ncbi:replication initiation factor domain-containing protein [Clostridium perfringens]|uniref:replication initiation factor domain-containing protein n=1 Tax=Clostridium perfringens TaxID=1502 RepID=UPI000E0A1440|nr:replication initiation factor domain-containing protein [Clostridium perfringens]AXH53466.1 replication initiation factor domain-containing protein [Clostridium perfringens]MBI6030837.1 replication initiation factor [Clostridium perfringens]MBI6034173.1 replication initiation factor [Clostridium perfringens]MCI5750249.1 replication initiation factor domain-containing protein [Clostridium perfringens]MDY4420672.1 replication initiation factor domain-containing protein [Clostridium perfringen